MTPTQGWGTMSGEWLVWNWRVMVMLFCCFVGEIQPKNLSTGLVNVGWSSNFTVNYHILWLIPDPPQWLKSHASRRCFLVELPWNPHFSGWTSDFARQGLPCRRRHWSPSRHPWNWRTTGRYRRTGTLWNYQMLQADRLGLLGAEIVRFPWVFSRQKWGKNDSWLSQWYFKIHGVS